LTTGKYKKCKKGKKEETRISVAREVEFYDAAAGRQAANLKGWSVPKRNINFMN